MVNKNNHKSKKKRIREKQEKMRLQRELNSRKVETRKQSINRLRQLYYEEEQKEIQRQNLLEEKRLKKEKQRKNKQNRKKQLRNEKLQYIHSQGYTDIIPSAKELDKSWDYIKSKYKKYSYDYNQVCQFKDGKRMYIAYRDYSQENNFNEILQMLDRLSEDELMERLTNLVNTPPIHSGKGSGSSGKAGDFKFMIADQKTIELFNNETRNKNRRKPKRKYQHTGENKGYQVLHSGNRVSFNEYKPKKLLSVAVAIMDNVTEGDRTAFYNNFYVQMKEHNPEFAKLLPPPKY